MREEFTPYECHICGEGRLSCSCYESADVFALADIEWKERDVWA